MKKTFLVVVCLLAVCILSCSSLPFPNSDWKSEEVTGKNVVVFVPGLFGSALSDAASGERVFQTFGQALWGGSLALNGPSLGISGTRELQAECLLESVSILGLYSADGYGESVRYLQKEFGSNARIIPFYYDWREDDLKGVQKLGTLVRSLRNAGAKRIALVGHSLGGILISFYLRYGQQELTGIKENWDGAKLVDAAVIAGSPFKGTLAAYRDLLQGTKVGLASTPLSALALGSFPSYYQFLPPIEQYPDVYKPENWKTWKMGLYSDTNECSTEHLIARDRFTEKSLKNGLLFNTLLRAKTKSALKKKIPYLAISGTGFKTLIGVKNNKEWETSKEGDGLVTIESALPPEAFKNSLYFTHHVLPLEHRGMFTAKVLQEKVTAFLKAQGF